jgi:putative transposase
MIKHIESASNRFFREKNDFLKFKSKKNSIQLFPIPQHHNVDFENDTFKLPKIGEIKEVIHKIFEGELKPLLFRSFTVEITTSTF